MGGWVELELELVRGRQDGPSSTTWVATTRVPTDNAPSLSPGQRDWFTSGQTVAACSRPDRER